MFSIVLKDGSKKEFNQSITGIQLAESISSSLAKKACLVKVNGELWDLSRELTPHAQVEILTREDPEVLEVLRHDAAHVFAEAIKALYKDVQVTIGPAIENGFYYDFYKKEPFHPEELEKIEQKMRDIVDAKEPFTREVWDRSKAIQYFKSIGEHFKVEIIEGIPGDQDISVYKQGNFIDLCRGPHMPHTGFVGKAFKLTKISGAYWRGDSKNPMLQRIYGTAWATDQQLKDYLHMIEEAEKRDHRKLGPQLGLFHLQEEAVGSVFWHPKGWTLYKIIEQYIRQSQEKYGFVEVKTPQLLDKKLWEMSGHWEKFRENMFVFTEEHDHGYALKPMSCPCHVQIFKQGIKSYRDLPLRMAEFGCCHRNEAKGALHGIMRVRAFNQDDGHIFCTPDQIVEETKRFCEMLRETYHDLGFDHFKVRFSDRPEKRAGSDEVWDQAEQALKEAALSAGLDLILNPGEGAFYGPKLEFVLSDALGREWQCGTWQVDFVLPERLGAHYIDEKGEKKHAVMLHKAVLGTFERFIGIMIEHYAGAFPFWLSPVQIVVTTITDAYNNYAQEIFNQLKAQGYRVEIDTRNEKIGYKVREHSLQKIPYILVIGKNEATDHTVTVRTLGEQQTETITLDAFSQRIKSSSSK